MQKDRFLVGKACSGCGKLVEEIQTIGKNKALLYYCDEGIKGFDAPMNDPMKKELTCNLILCPECESKQRIDNDKENTGRGGRRASRQRSTVD